MSLVDPRYASRKRKEDKDSVPNCQKKLYSTTEKSPFEQVTLPLSLPPIPTLPDVELVPGAYISKRRAYERSREAKPAAPNLIDPTLTEQRASTSRVRITSLWDSERQAVYGDFLSEPDVIRKAKNVKAKAFQAPNHLLMKFEHRTSSLVSSVNCIQWSPFDGALLLSAAADGSVILWDPFRSKSKSFILRAHQKSVCDAKWGADGRSVLSGGYDNHLVKTDIETGKELVNWAVDSCVVSVYQQPDNESVLAAGMMSGSVLAWDIREPLPNVSKHSLSGGKFVRRIEKIPGELFSMEFLSPSKLVTCCSPADRGAFDMSIVVWDWNAGIALSNGIFTEPYPCTFLLKHPKDDCFLGQCTAGYIAQFSSKAPYKLKRKISAEFSTLGYKIRFDVSKDGEILSTGSTTGKVYVLCRATSRVIKTLRMSECKKDDVCLGVVHHPVLSTVMASCYQDGKVAIWM